MKVYRSTSTIRIGLVAGVTALVVALSMPGLAALAVGGQGSDPLPEAVVQSTSQVAPATGSISQASVIPDDDLIAQLVESGISLAVTGDVLELADVPEGQPTLFLALGDGHALALDETTLSVPLEPGQTVSAVVDVPGEVVTEMADQSQAELVASPGLDDAVAGEVIEAESPVGKVLVEAASAQAAQVEATELEIVANAPVQAAAPAPRAHELEIVFMSKSGRGKFWTEAQLDGLVQRLADYWVRHSRGVISGFTYSYAATQAVTTNITCSGSTSSIMAQAAQALGYTSYSPFTSSGSSRHLVVISLREEKTSDCTNNYGGIAVLGGSAGLAEGGYTHLFVSNDSTHYYDTETFIHEIGHNLSLHHAGAGVCPAGVVDGPFSNNGAVCGVEPYGDKWNVMGSTVISGVAADKYASGLNGRQKEKLKLIDASSGLQTISSNGTYDVQLQAKSAAGGSGIEAVKIVEPSPYREYSIEYDPTAGGVTIRRVVIGADQSLRGDGDTVILSANQTTLTGPQVFKAGQVFVAGSGLLSVVPTQISGGTANLHIIRGPQVVPTLSLSATSWMPVATGQVTTVTAITNQPSWSASSNSSWLTVSPASGSSGAALTLTAAPNDQTSPRLALVTVTAGGLGATIEVRQAGAVVPPILSLSTTTWLLEATGGSLPVTVTTTQDSWSAASNRSWLTISPATGVSGQSITVSASANTNLTPRVGTINVIAGKGIATLTVTQVGTAPASVSLSSSLAGVVAAGGSGVAVVTVSTNVVSGWRLRQGLPNWLTASTQTGPLGATTISFSATANTGRAARVFEVGFEADAADPAWFKIAQSGTGTATLTLSRTTYTAANGGAATTATVTTNQATWTAVSSQAWLAVSPGVGVTGNTVTVNAEPNQTSSARSATVTVRAGTLSRTLTVRQAAGTLTLSPSTTYATPVAGGTRSVRVTTSVPAGWAVSSNASWVTVTPATGATGQSFSIQTAGNDGPARNATVTVTAGGLSRTISVTQGAATLTVQVASYAAGAAGSSRTVTVSTNVAAGWTATSDQPWVNVSQTGSAFTLAVAANPTTQSRTAAVTVTAGQLVRRIAVTQSGTAWVNPSLVSWTTGFGASQAAITVLTNQPNWTATSSARWATLSPASGLTGQSLVLSVAANSGARRTATITVRAGVASRTITITQAGAGYVNLAVTQWVAPATELSTPVQVTSRSTWTATSSDTTWLTVSPSSGRTGATLNLTAQPNPTGQERSAIVTVTSSSQSATILVTQDG